MEIVVWIIFGAVAGWMANTVMGGDNSLIGDLILGVVGALIGGFVMNMLGQQGVTGFNIYSLIVAVMGSIIVLFIARLFTQDRRLV